MKKFILSLLLLTATIAEISAATGEQSMKKTTQQTAEQPSIQKPANKKLWRDLYT